MKRMLIELRVPGPLLTSSWHGPNMLVPALTRPSRLVDGDVLKA